MDAHELTRLLQSLRDGSIDTDEVVRRLKWSAPFEEAGDFAKVTQAGKPQ